MSLGEYIQNNTNVHFMTLVYEFPHRVHRQWDRQQQEQIAIIDHMYRGYHSAKLTLLEDEAAFREEGEFLKRMYDEDEWGHKIVLLGDYYQYHHQLPRLFQLDQQGIIQNYHQDIRGLEYKLVRRKMGDGQGGPLSSRQKTLRPVNKIIRNIDLSYINFQKKNIKRQRPHDSNKLQQKSKAALSKSKKSLPLLPLYQIKNQKDQIKNQKDGRIKDQRQTFQESKKPSSNNSVDSPKTLSRAKSKSNLPVQQKVPEKTEFKVRSGHCSLQRAQSKRDVRERKPLGERTERNQRVSVRKEGLKNMFKKAVQAKKPIGVSK